MNEEKQMGILGRIRIIRWLLAAGFTLFGSCGLVLAQVAPVEVVVPRFEIRSFEVSGNTLLTPAEVEGAVAPYSGQQKDFADIQRALEALEQVYIDRGYGVVQVLLPEQDITRGVVRLRVIEPTIGKVVVEGNRYFTESNVRATLPGLQPGATPNSRLLATNLQLLAEHPAKRTTVLLKAGASDKEVDAVVTVADEKPLKFVATFDNSGTDATGRFRTGIAMQHSNVFNRDHTLNLQYITSPENPNKVTVIGGAYRIPFYAYNSSLDMFAAYSDANSGSLSSVGGAINISGSGTILGVRYNLYLPKYGEYEHKLSFGLDYRAYQPNITDEFGVRNPAFPDVTVTPVSVAYSALWRTTGTQVGYYAAVSQNIPGSNDGGDNSFKASNAEATANYRILRWGANVTHVFGNDWQARAVVNGQSTNDALIAGEQFGVGGPDSVRGFNIREFASDKGYAASLEIYTPELARKIGAQDVKMRLLGFYDLGGVSGNSIPLGQTQSQNASSFGFGLRMTYGKHFNLRLDYAQVEHPAGNQGRGDQMLQGSVAIPF